MGLVFLPVGLPLLEGTAGSEFGAALAGGGDTDGDGASELLVGAPAADAVFLYEAVGGAMGDTAVVSWAGATTGDRFGEVVIFADLDGDGVDEAVVAAPVPGAVSVFEGQATSSARTATCSTAGDGLEGGYAYLYVQEEYFWEDWRECESSYDLDVTTVADVDLATPTSRGVVGARFDRLGSDWETDEATGVIRWSDGSISSFSAWEEDRDYATESGDYAYSITARGVEVDGCVVEISERAKFDYGDYEHTTLVSMGADAVTVIDPPRAACGSEFPSEGPDFAVAWYNGAVSPVDRATWEPYLGSGTDADGDRWPDDYDCDDTDDTVHPCVVEIDGDLLDNDCDGVMAGESDLDGDGTIDEFDCAPENPDAEVFVAVFEDLDGDGYGGAAAGTACEIPDGLVVRYGDCDDADAAVNPGVAEMCAAGDEDCDGDEGAYAIDAPDWYADEDGDGYGSAAGRTRSCTQPADHVGNNEDCDDADNAVHPGAAEIPGDGIDQDCVDGDPIGAQAANAPIECACSVGGRGSAWFALLSLAVVSLRRPIHSQRC